MTDYYSPSSTIKYQECPKLYQLDKLYTPKASISKWQPHIALGCAIHAGLKTHYEMLRDGFEPPTKYDYQDAIKTLQIALEGEFVPGDEWTLEGLTKLATGGLLAGIKSDFPCGGKILLVDEDVGGFQADLVYRDKEGYIRIPDHKTKLSLRPEYVDNELAKYETSWQLAHYAWALGQRYGEHVRWAGVHLIVLSPRPKAYVHWVEFTPERLAMWHEDAEMIWADMDASKTGRIKYVRNWGHCQKYGKDHRCPMYTACHDLAGDESRYSAFYDKRVR